MKKAPKRRLRGLSYSKRVADINRIYDEHARSGLTNREIWRRYIWPRYPISERTLYNILKASADPRVQLTDDDRQLMLFPEEDLTPLPPPAPSGPTEEPWT